MLKKAGLLVFAILLLAACRRSSNDIARDLILRYGELHYKHYQPIAFEMAQEYYVPYERSAQCIAYSKQQKTLKQQKDSLHRLIAIHNKPAYLLQSGLIDSSLNSVETAMAQSKQNYKAERHGWMIMHRYNHKPDNGLMVQGASVFVVDDAMKNIIETYDK